MLSSVSADSDLRSRKCGNKFNNNKHVNANGDDTSSWTDEAQVLHLFIYLYLIFVSLFTAHTHRCNMSVNIISSAVLRLM